jgi:hypothetical protein
MMFTARPELLLLPSTTERLVELHEALIFVAARGGPNELGIEQRPLPVEHFEICGNAALVTHFGEADRLGQIIHGLFPPDAHFMEFLKANQGVGYITECVLNCFFVRG